MKTTDMIFSLLLVFAVVLTGCGQTAPGQDGQNVEKTINATIHTNKMGSLLTVVAENAGYNKEEGIKMKFTVLNGPAADSLSALATRKVDITTGGIGSTGPLKMIDNGTKFLIIGGQMSEGADLITLPEHQSEWKTITAESVRGKKIGVIRASSGDIALRGYIQDQGIDVSSIQFVELADYPTIMEALKKGEIDVGNIATNFRDVAHDNGLVTAAYVDSFVPDFICCRLLTTPQYAKENRAELVHLLRAQLKAYHLYRTDKEKTLDLAKQTIEVDENILRRQAYEYGHLKFSPDPEKKRVEEYYNAMKSVKYVEGRVNIDEYIDTSIYKDALDSLTAEAPEDPIWKELQKKYSQIDQ